MQKLAVESSALLQLAGVNTDDLLITQPDSGETALEIVDQVVRSTATDIIVIDSVAALVPRAELEGEIGDKQSMFSFEITHCLLVLAGNTQESLGFGFRNKSILAFKGYHCLTWKQLPYCTASTRRME